MAKNQVTVTFAGDAKQLSRTFSKIRSESDKTDSSISGASQRIGSSFGSMAKKAAVAATAVTALAGAAAFQLGRSLLSTADDASDLNEALSKVETVFGSSSGTITAWADNAATALGISKSEALDAAGSFGNMFDQLGFTGDQASDMSREIIGLASDFGSFHNADISQVIEAQSAAFRGEYDSLQQFLPLINAATVEQKALELGLAGTKDELTAQDKALAVHTLMMEGAGEAQGDFARTSDGLANSQRIAEAQMADMRAEIGQKMIPVAQKLTEIKLKLAGFLADKLAPAIDKVTGFLSDNRGTFEAIGSVIMDTVLPAAREFISGVVDRIQGGVSFLMEYKDTWIAIGDAFMSTVVPAAMQVGEWIASITSNKDAMLAIGIGVAAVLVPAFVSWAVSAAAAAAATLLAMAPLILIGAAVAGLAYLVITNWDTIKEKTGAVWNWIKSTTSSVWNGISSAVSAVFSRIKNTITTHINAIKTTFRVFKTVVTSIFRTLSTALTSPFRTAFRKIKNLWNNSVGGFGFSVPSWIPGVGGKGFTIPKMAEGGVVSSPTLAMIGEGGESEAVVPLSKLDRMINSSGSEPVVIELRSGGARIDDVILDVLRRSINSRGGNVQAVMG